MFLKENKEIEVTPHENKFHYIKTTWLIMQIVFMASLMLLIYHLLISSSAKGNWCECSIILGHQIHSCQPQGKGDNHSGWQRGLKMRISPCASTRGPPQKCTFTPREPQGMTIAFFSTCLVVIFYLPELHN